MKRKYLIEHYNIVARPDPSIVDFIRTVCRRLYE
jgi:hypothetical protein